MRINWRELRADEEYEVIGDRSASGWEFFEKSSWEVRWYPLAPSARLLAMARILASPQEVREPTDPLVDAVR